MDYRTIGIGHFPDFLFHDTGKATDEIIDMGCSLHFSFSFFLSFFLTLYIDILHSKLYLSRKKNHFSSESESSIITSQCSQHRGHNSKPAISSTISTPQQSEIIIFLLSFFSIILHILSSIARKKIRKKEKIFWHSFCWSVTPIMGGFSVFCRY